MLLYDYYLYYYILLHSIYYISLDYIIYNFTLLHTQKIFTSSDFFKLFKIIDCHQFFGGISRWRPTGDVGGWGREMEEEGDLDDWC